MSDLLKVRVGGSSYLCKWEELGVVIGGRKYKTVKIGTQEWLAENLDYKFEVNGEPLDIGEQYSMSTPAAWYYNNNENDYGVDGIYKCGLLYNWYAVDYLEQNKSSLLPNGWHVPSKTEWESLIMSVGANPGTKLKALDNSVISGFPSGWNGSDDYGFGMLPCGTRSTGSTPFRKLNELVFPWTATVYVGDSTLAYSSALRYYDSNCPMEGDYKYCGNIVRLVKDAT